jgi:hypothetical protein
MTPEVPCKRRNTSQYKRKLQSRSKALNHLTELQNAPQNRYAKVQQQRFFATNSQPSIKACNAIESIGQPDKKSGSGVRRNHSGKLLRAASYLSYRRIILRTFCRRSGFYSADRSALSQLKRQRRFSGT